MEIYVSTDVETDGPIPGPHSMLSLGSVAFTNTGEEIAEFSCNLELLPSATPHPDTELFWRENAEAYAATRTNLEYPAAAMIRYRSWLVGLPGTPVFVAYPAGFDFTFVYWYLIKFTGSSPFSFSALDIKTYAMNSLNCGFRDATKRNWPRRWRSKLPHTHVALDDARAQGEEFIQMLKERQSK
jgi:DNA polymerase III alpha subunit (gram-positive type)